MIKKNSTEVEKELDTMISKLALQSNLTLAQSADSLKAQSIPRAFNCCQLMKLEKLRHAKFIV